MSKFEVERFETPPDPDLICCICQCVLDRPLESPCRHVFCKICIETWLTNRKSCPNCRERLRSWRLKPVLPIVKNMINRLVIRCENYDRGCTTGIKLEFYNSHSQNCGYEPLKCMNMGCDITVLRKDMLDHENECQFRLVKCKKGCSLPICVEQQDSHNCLEELKKSIQAMEDKNDKRIKEILSNFNVREERFKNQLLRLEAKVNRLEHNQSESSWMSYDSQNDDLYTLANLSPSNSQQERDRVDTGDDNDQQADNNSSDDGQNDPWERSSDDSYATGRDSVDSRNQDFDWSWGDGDEQDQQGDNPIPPSSESPESPLPETPASPLYSPLSPARSIDRGIIRPTNNHQPPQSEVLEERHPETTTRNSSRNGRGQRSPVSYNSETDASWEPPSGEVSDDPTLSDSFHTSEMSPMSDSTRTYRDFLLSGWNDIDQWPSIFSSRDNDGDSSHDEGRSRRRRMWHRRRTRHNSARRNSNSQENHSDGSTHDNTHEPDSHGSNHNNTREMSHQDDNHSSSDHGDQCHNNSCHDDNHHSDVEVVNDSSHVSPDSQHHENENNSDINSVGLISDFDSESLVGDVSRRSHQDNEPVEHDRNSDHASDHDHSDRNVSDNDGRARSDHSDFQSDDYHNFYFDTNSSDHQEATGHRSRTEEAPVRGKRVRKRRRSEGSNDAQRRSSRRKRCHIYSSSDDNSDDYCYDSGPAVSKRSFTL